MTLSFLFPPRKQCTVHAAKPKTNAQEAEPSKKAKQDKETPFVEEVTDEPEKDDTAAPEQPEAKAADKVCSLCQRSGRH